MRSTLPRRQDKGSMLDQYLVIFHAGEWKISHDERQDGPYVSERAAITAAVARARIAAKRGKPTKVMVQEDGDSFREEWNSASQAEDSSALSRHVRRN
jgi:hypothetical protein